MKMKIYLALLTSLFCVLSAPLFSQDEQYDAVYEKLVKEYTLNPDGSTDFRYIKQQKLQTYRAFHNLYGETFIVYDTVNQKLKIDEVYTVMADGKKVVTPENAFNPVLPGFASGAPAYNSLREMVVTHTGLERNATVFLDYTIHTKPGVIPFLSGNELLAENEPVRNLEIRIRVPEGTELFHTLLNSELKPEESEDGKYRIYTWKFTNVPAISAEENQPETNSTYPRLLFSSSENITDGWNFLSAQPAFWFELPEDARAYAGKLSNSEKDRFRLALKLQEQVVSNMSQYDIPFRYTLYRIRPADKTWKSNGGTRPEKAVLLTALLRAAGFDARVAVVVKSAYKNDRLANLNNIDDFVVWVDLKEKGEWYLSASSLNQVNLFNTMPGRTFVIFGADGKTTEKETAGVQNTVKVIGNFLVSSDPKLTGEVSLYMSGSIYPFAGLSRDKGVMKSMLTGNIIKADSSALKKSVLNNDNGYQLYVAQNDKPFRRDSMFYVFSLPVVSGGIDGWGIRTLSEKRASGFEIPSLADESYDYIVTLPVTLVPFTPEKKQTISNKAGSFTFEVKHEKGKISVKRSMKFSRAVVTAEDYAGFKALMDAWNNPWNRQVVLQGSL